MSSICLSSGDETFMAWPPEKSFQRPKNHKFKTKMQSARPTGEQALILIITHWATAKSNVRGEGKEGLTRAKHGFQGRSNLRKKIPLQMALETFSTL